MEHNHRLYDFVELGESIFRAAGLEAGRFIKHMDELRSSTGEEIASGDAFIISIRRVLASLAREAETGGTLPGYKAWFTEGHAAVKRPDGNVVVGVRPKKLF